MFLKWFPALFQTKMVSFELPASASSNDSKCDNTSSILMLKFPDGHSWSANFSLKDKSYQADAITFVYNLNDSKVFPGSSSNGNFCFTRRPLQSMGGIVFFCVTSK